MYNQKIYKNSSDLELIKYISIITMIIDHVGLLFYPGFNEFRIIGRFALIGFSFILAYNYRYNTKNKTQYKIRLFKWAIISQVPYSLAFGYEAGINIMFLLLMALITIDIFSSIYKNEKVLMPSFYLTTILILSYYTGYFLFGVLVIVFFYFALDNKINIIFLLLSLAALNFSLLYAPFALVYAYIILYRLDTSFNIPRLQGYYFYAFYPTHLLILWLIALI